MQDCFEWKKEEVVHQVRISAPVLKGHLDVGRGSNGFCKVSYIFLIINREFDLANVWIRFPT